MEAGKHNLPQTIYHPAHPRPDELVLRQYSTHKRLELGSNCSICLKAFEKGDYIYECVNCSRFACHFTVDIACSSIKARVDFRGHEHSLFFLERIHPCDSNPCYACKKYSYELLFRCASDCGYSLHLSCGPLPVSIQYHHSGHELTLRLMDALLDGADPEDSWCDICEERRDPMKCVYRSEDPPFTATIDCLLPQIVGILQGDHGDVRLRTVREHIPGNVIVVAQGDAEEVIVERNIETNSADENNVDFTFNGEEFLIFNGENIYDSLSEEDEKLMVHAATEFEKRGLAEGVHGSTTFKFSDEAFKQFKEHAIIGKVDFESLSLYRWLDERHRLVKVGSNFVHPELVTFYLQIVDKHGDFAARCPLSPTVKAGFLMLLLMLIQSTQGLQICEITGDLLVSLQFYLECIGGKLGFDVQFARDNMEKLACACYALKFVKAREDITEDLTQKTEQLERDIPEDKPKIEALKEQHRRAKESVFVKQCLAEASALKWKNAGELLGLDQVEE